jgi:cardiolipin-specific phospholipase
MGCSSRPDFPGWDGKLDERQNVRKHEDFFIDALEEWREQVGIESMVLAGHSLGGYRSTDL